MMQVWYDKTVAMEALERCQRSLEEEQTVRCNKEQEVEDAWVQNRDLADQVLIDLDATHTDHNGLM